VPGGSFQMGSATGDADEAPVHTVTIASFTISKYEITQAQYSTVIGREPSYFTGNVARPVERVTWYEAVEFCNELSRLENLDMVYTISGRTPATGYPITSASVAADWSKGGYRLPTEAEWEYAAIGGKQLADFQYAGSNTVGDVGWYSVNSSETTHAVGEKLPNELGLLDMSGNVIEWCWDWYQSDYYTSSEASGPNPKGPVAGSNRVMRGGSYYSSTTNTLRSANRESKIPSLIGANYGFRVARGAVQ
ncbi:MAG: SUMF1/EgtB/PvdO family nonheme iron enzyme, partial [Spirochaetaceae bacterium]|nr:SUMF1/EgtB/PvdO family nonheme iron enzyme [Spirochaetaceae bacterium]